MRSARVEFVVVKRLLPPLPSRMDRPGAPGTLGLIVATSKVGFASAGISLVGGGGGGISHAVVAVARVRFKGMVGPPWVQVPAMVSPSPLSLPSKLPPIAATVIF